MFLLRYYSFLSCTARHYIISHFTHYTKQYRRHRDSRELISCHPRSFAAIGTPVFVRFGVFYHLVCTAKRKSEPPPNMKLEVENTLLFFGG